MMATIGRILSLAAAVMLVGCGSESQGTDWPAVDGPFARDEAMERRIAAIVDDMSLAQKIGQMTQPEIKSIAPDEVREYYIGSVLNGGGSWPGGDMYAGVDEWVALADAYHEASMSTDMETRVPIIWGVDAVHGHNNIFGATLFPHNIGLGAARNPDLIADIGASVGRAVRATGIDWVFAPTVAIADNPRWGRTYESFSADAGLVREYARQYVRALQGEFANDGNVVATAKHFIGDGATHHGINEGVSFATHAEMVGEHGQGYYGALDAGVQTVMASFNSWNDIDSGIDYGKIHGSRALLTTALKDKMGFDGFVVSDWNAIGQVPGCTNSHCPAAINAGVDMIMVPFDWRDFIANTVRDVESGAIPMGRIDDAVTRILRVKMRAGLFDCSPSSGKYTGDAAAVVDAALARKAVRQSLVLLKNDNGALPLSRAARILVVGRNADNLPAQVGGWSLTWQGDEISNSDFPNGQTILQAVEDAVGAENVVFDENGDGRNAADYDAVIAVIGEGPYAESAGDIPPHAPVFHTTRIPEDLDLLSRVTGKGTPVITLLISGRVLYANDLMNHSDAFVAAWLPGTEGAGVADVLFRDRAGEIVFDFRGRLPFAWPGSPCLDKAPLFPLGFGLTYQDEVLLGALPVATPPASCGVDTPQTRENN